MSLGKMAFLLKPDTIYIMYTVPLFRELLRMWTQLSELQRKLTRAGDNSGIQRQSLNNYMLRIR